MSSAERRQHPRVACPTTPPRGLLRPPATRRGASRADADVEAASSAAPPVAVDGTDRRMARMIGDDRLGACPGRQRQARDRRRREGLSCATVADLLQIRRDTLKARMR